MNSPAPVSDQERTGKTGSKTRWILPVAVLLAWLIAGGLFGSYAGQLSSVQVNDNLQFLPESAESTAVAKLQAEFSDDDSIPTVLVYESDSGTLSQEQLGQIAAQAQELADIPGVTEQPSGPIPSEDGEAALVLVPVDGSDGALTAAAVEEVRGVVEASTIAGVSVYVGGPAGFLADLTEAFEGIDGLLLLVAVVVVLVILLIVYRSPILPFVVLMSSILALGVASAVIYALAVNEILTLNGQAQGILSILVIGAATDYALLLVARFREELHVYESPYEAMRKAWRGVVEPIAASGGTVIIGVMMLVFSDLKVNKGLGPVAAIGILFAMLAGLTFLPAVLVLLGRSAFWPLRPNYGTEISQDTGVWSKVSGFVGRRYRMVWIVTAVGLALLAAFAPTFKADGVPASQFFTTTVASTQAQEALERHFPAGSGSETIVITPDEELPATLTVVEANPGVASAIPVSEEADQDATGPPAGSDGQDGGQPTVSTDPLVVSGNVLIEVTLTDASDSQEAEETVVQLRDELNAVSSAVLVGGPTASQYDNVTSAQRDVRVIIPLVLIVILLVLMLLLRAVVGPIMLIGTVVLSFAATLGLAALIFNHILDLPGADPSVPLFGFVFLVALGIDYNIFLMTRAREETPTVGTRKGILRALTVTGGVITSAGLVLAATFSALAVLPLLFLFQIAFIVAVGVLIDTFIVRSLLVPGLVMEIGPPVWWPSRLARIKGDPAQEQAELTDSVT
jgi:RND superfamily putative drug exporter